MPSPKTWFVLVNPTSGGGRAKRRWPSIEKSLALHGFDFHSAQTQYRGHGVELVASAVEQGYKQFICVGGDGTLHETVNALMRETEVVRSELKIGILPIGTGNDWARQFNIPKNTEDAILKLKKAHASALDIGCITLRQEPSHPVYFNNVAGVGFDGHVIKIINRFKNLGALAYLAGALSGLFTYQKFDAIISWKDKRLRSSFLMIIAGLGKYAGGGMRLTSDPNPSDGYLDLSIAGNLSRFQVLKLFPFLFNGKITRSPFVKTDKINGLSVEVKGGVKPLIEADGELVGAGSFTIRIVPKALNFIK